LYLIVGLGNPGLLYKNTRHNAGAMVLDGICKNRKLKFSRTSGPYQSTAFTFRGEKVILIKSRTYMNESGRAVNKAINEMRLKDLSRLLVISDDINLPFGSLRIRAEGSAGGQKGLQSIIDSLGTSQFPRLRIGIGDHFSDAVEYVLSPFGKKELENLPFILQYAMEAVESFLAEGLTQTMSRFNRNFLET
jgi:PTH1 family peptidyl-tRNA hydrolase